jgi:hypothetical protein
MVRKLVHCVDHLRDVAAAGLVIAKESCEMVDVDGEAIAISHGNNPQDLFPGYYPPTEEERRDAYRRGLVSLDANALLDLYRFSERARNEFLRFLRSCVRDSS